VAAQILKGVSLVTFFAPAKKVTRSSAGGVEALALENNIKMDSRFRGNDNPESYPLLRRRSGSSGFKDKIRSKNWMTSFAVEERLQLALE
jgi:hypothetical protein